MTQGILLYLSGGSLWFVVKSGFRTETFKTSAEMMRVFLGSALLFPLDILAFACFLLARGVTIVLKDKPLDFPTAKRDQATRVDTEMSETLIIVLRNMKRPWAMLAILMEARKYIDLDADMRRAFEVGFTANQLTDLRKIDGSYTTKCAKITNGETL